jgi:hypothetical protein
LRKTVGRGKLKFVELLSVILVLLMLCPIVFAQTNHAFTPQDRFSFPDGSSMSFSADGYYDSATFIDDKWTFVNLVANASASYSALNVTVSGSGADFTVLYSRRFNTTLNGVILRYTVNGSSGEQVFDFGFKSKDGSWTVSFNQNLVAQADGWMVSDVSKITVTGATSNVTLMYFSYTDLFQDDSNKPFIERHSVVIGSSVALSVTVFVALTIKLRTRTPKKETNSKW